jgi:hypothetical protein
MDESFSNLKDEDISKLIRENKELKRSIWWLRAFAICVIVVQLYDMLSK